MMILLIIIILLIMMILPIMLIIPIPISILQVTEDTVSNPLRRLANPNS